MEKDLSSAFSSSVPNMSSGSLPVGLHPPVYEALGRYMDAIHDALSQTSPRFFSFERNVKLPFRPGSAVRQRGGFPGSASASFSSASHRTMSRFSQETPLMAGENGAGALELENSPSTYRGWSTTAGLLVAVVKKLLSLRVQSCFSSGSFPDGQQRGSESLVFCGPQGIVSTLMGPGGSGSSRDGGGRSSVGSRSSCGSGEFLSTSGLRGGGWEEGEGPGGRREGGEVLPAYGQTNEDMTAAMLTGCIDTLLLLALHGSSVVSLLDFIRLIQQILLKFDKLEEKANRLRCRASLPCFPHHHHHDVCSHPGGLSSRGVVSAANESCPPDVASHQVFPSNSVGIISPCCSPSFSSTLGRKSEDGEGVCPSEGRYHGKVGSQQTGTSPKNSLTKRSPPPAPLSFSSSFSPTHVDCHASPSAAGPSHPFLHNGRIFQPHSSPQDESFFSPTHQNGHSCSGWPADSRGGSSSHHPHGSMPQALPLSSSLTMPPSSLPPLSPSEDGREGFCSSSSPSWTPLLSSLSDVVLPPTFYPSLQHLELLALQYPVAFQSLPGPQSVSEGHEQDSAGGGGGGGDAVDGETRENGPHEEEAFGNVTRKTKETRHAVAPATSSTRVFLSNGIPGYGGGVYCCQIRVDLHDELLVGLSPSLCSPSHRFDTVGGRGGVPLISPGGGRYYSYGDEEESSYFGRDFYMPRGRGRGNRRAGGWEDDMDGGDICCCLDVLYDNEQRIRFQHETRSSTQGRFFTSDPPNILLRFEFTLDALVVWSYSSEESGQKERVRRRLSPWRQSMLCSSSQGTVLENRGFPRPSCLREAEEARAGEDQGSGNDVSFDEASWEEKSDGAEAGAGSRSGSDDLFTPVFLDEREPEGSEDSEEDGLGRDRSPRKEHRAGGVEGTRAKAALFDLRGVRSVVLDLLVDSIHEGSEEDVIGRDIYNRWKEGEGNWGEGGRKAWKKNEDEGRQRRGAEGGVAMKTRERRKLRKPTTERESGGRGGDALVIFANGEKLCTIPIPVSARYSSASHLFLPSLSPFSLPKQIFLKARLNTPAIAEVRVCDKPSWSAAFVEELVARDILHYPFPHRKSSLRVALESDGECTTPSSLSSLSCKKASEDLDDDEREVELLSQEEQAHAGGRWACEEKEKELVSEAGNKKPALETQPQCLRRRHSLERDGRQGLEVAKEAGKLTEVSPNKATTEETADHGHHFFSNRQGHDVEDKENIPQENEGNSSEGAARSPPSSRINGGQCATVPVEGNVTTKPYTAQSSPPPLSPSFAGNNSMIFHDPGLAECRERKSSRADKTASCFSALSPCGSTREKNGGNDLTRKGEETDEHLLSSHLASMYSFLTLREATTASSSLALLGLEELLRRVCFALHRLVLRCAPPTFLVGGGKRRKRRSASLSGGRGSAAGRERCGPREDRRLKTSKGNLVDPFRGRDVGDEEQEGEEGENEEEEEEEELYKTSRDSGGCYASSGGGDGGVLGHSFRVLSPGNASLLFESFVKVLHLQCCSLNQICQMERSEWVGERKEEEEEGRAGNSGFNQGSKRSSSSSLRNGQVFSSSAHSEAYASDNRGERNPGIYGYGPHTSPVLFPSSSSLSGSPCVSTPHHGYHPSSLPSPPCSPSSHRQATPTGGCSPSASSFSSSAVCGDACPGGCRSGEYEASVPIRHECPRNAGTISLTAVHACPFSRRRTVQRKWRERAEVCCSLLGVFRCFLRDSHVLLQIEEELLHGNVTEAGAYSSSNSSGTVFTHLGCLLFDCLLFLLGTAPPSPPPPRCHSDGAQASAERSMADRPGGDGLGGRCKDADEKREENEQGESPSPVIRESSGHPDGRGSLSDVKPLDFASRSVSKEETPGTSSLCSQQKTELRHASSSSSSSCGITGKAGLISDGDDAQKRSCPSSLSFSCPYCFYTSVQEEVDTEGVAWLLHRGALKVLTAMEKCPSLLPSILWRIPPSRFQDLLRILSMERPFESDLAREVLSVFESTGASEVLVQRIIRETKGEEEERKILEMEGKHVQRMKAFVAMRNRRNQSVYGRQAGQNGHENRIEGRGGGRDGGSSALMVKYSSSSGYLLSNPLSQSSSQGSLLHHNSGKGWTNGTVAASLPSSPLHYRIPFSQKILSYSGSGCSMGDGFDPFWGGRGRRRMFWGGQNSHSSLMSQNSSSLERFLYGGSRHQQKEGSGGKRTGGGGEDVSGPSVDRFPKNQFSFDFAEDPFSSGSNLSAGISLSRPVYHSSSSGSVYDNSSSCYRSSSLCRTFSSGIGLVGGGGYSWSEDGVWGGGSSAGEFPGSLMAVGGSPDASSQDVKRLQRIPLSSARRRSDSSSTFSTFLGSHFKKSGRRSLLYPQFSLVDDVSEERDHVGVRDDGVGGPQGERRRERAGDGLVAYYNKSSVDALRVNLSCLEGSGFWPILRYLLSVTQHQVERDLHLPSIRRFAVERAFDDHLSEESFRHQGCGGGGGGGRRRAAGLRDLGLWNDSSDKSKLDSCYLPLCYPSDASLDLQHLRASSLLTASSSGADSGVVCPEVLCSPSGGVSFLDYFYYFCQSSLFSPPTERRRRKGLLGQLSRRDESVALKVRNLYASLQLVNSTLFSVNMDTPSPCWGRWERGGRSLSSGFEGERFGFIRRHRLAGDVTGLLARHASRRWLRQLWAYLLDETSTPSVDSAHRSSLSREGIGEGENEASSASCNQTVFSSRRAGKREFRADADDGLRTLSPPFAYDRDAPSPPSSPCAFSREGRGGRRTCEGKVRTHCRRVEDLCRCFEELLRKLLTSGHGILATVMDTLVLSGGGCLHRLVPVTGAGLSTCSSPPSSFSSPPSSFFTAGVLTASTCTAMAGTEYGPLRTASPPPFLSGCCYLKETVLKILAEFASLVRAAGEDFLSSTSPLVSQKDSLLSILSPDNGAMSCHARDPLSAPVTSQEEGEEEDEEPSRKNRINRADTLTLEKSWKGRKKSPGVMLAIVQMGLRLWPHLLRLGLRSLLLIRQLGSCVSESGGEFICDSYEERQWHAKKRFLSLAHRAKGEGGLGRFPDKAIHPLVEVCLGFVTVTGHVLQSLGCIPFALASFEDDQPSHAAFSPFRIMNETGEGDQDSTANPASSPRRKIGRKSERNRGQRGCGVFPFTPGPVVTELPPLLLTGAKYMPSPQGHAFQAVESALRGSVLVLLECSAKTDGSLRSNHFSLPKGIQEFLAVTTAQKEGGGLTKASSVGAQQETRREGGEKAVRKGGCGRLIRHDRHGNALEVMDNNGIKNEGKRNISHDILLPEEDESENKNLLPASSPPCVVGPGEGAEERGGYAKLPRSSPPAGSNDKHFVCQPVLKGLLRSDIDVLSAFGSRFRAFHPSLSSVQHGIAAALLHLLGYKGDPRIKRRAGGGEGGGEDESSWAGCSNNDEHRPGVVRSHGAGRAEEKAGGGKREEEKASPQATQSSAIVRRGGFSKGRTNDHNVGGRPREQEEEEEQSHLIQIAATEARKAAVQLLSRWQRRGALRASQQNQASGQHETSEEEGQDSAHEGGESSKQKSSPLRCGTGSIVSEELMRHTEKRQILQRCEWILRVCPSGLLTPPGGSSSLVLGSGIAWPDSAVMAPHTSVSGFQNSCSGDGTGGVLVGTAGGETSSAGMGRVTVVPSAPEQTRSLSCVETIAVSPVYRVVLGGAGYGGGTDDNGSHGGVIADLPYTPSVLANACTASQHETIYNSNVGGLSPNIGPPMCLLRNASIGSCAVYPSCGTTPVCARDLAGGGLVSRRAGFRPRGFSVSMHPLHQDLGGLPGAGGTMTFAAPASRMSSGVLSAGGAESCHLFVRHTVTRNLELLRKLMCSRTLASSADRSRSAIFSSHAGIGGGGSGTSASHAGAADLLATELTPRGDGFRLFSGGGWLPLDLPPCSTSRAIAGGGTEGALLPSAYYCPSPSLQLVPSNSASFVNAVSGGFYDIPCPGYTPESATRMSSSSFHIEAGAISDRGGGGMATPHSFEYPRRDSLLCMPALMASARPEERERLRGLMSAVRCQGEDLNHCGAGCLGGAGAGGAMNYTAGVGGAMAVVPSQYGGDGKWRADVQTPSYRGLVLGHSSNGGSIACLPLSSLSVNVHLGEEQEKEEALAVFVAFLLEGPDVSTAERVLRVEQLASVCRYVMLRSLKALMLAGVCGAIPNMRKKGFLFKTAPLKRRRDPFHKSSKQALSSPLDDSTRASLPTKEERGQQTAERTAECPPNEITSPVHVVDKEKKSQEASGQHGSVAENGKVAMMIMKHSWDSHGSNGLKEDEAYNPHPRGADDDIRKKREERRTSREGEQEETERRDHDYESLQESGDRDHNVREDLNKETGEEHINVLSSPTSTATAQAKHGSVMVPSSSPSPKGKDRCTGNYDHSVDYHQHPCHVISSSTRSSRRSTLWPVLLDLLVPVACRSSVEQQSAFSAPSGAAIRYAGWILFKVLHNVGSMLLSSQPAATSSAKTTSHTVAPPRKAGDVACTSMAGGGDLPTSPSSGRFGTAQHGCGSSSSQSGGVLSKVEAEGRGGTTGGTEEAGVSREGTTADSPFWKMQPLAEALEMSLSDVVR